LKQTIHETNKPITRTKNERTIHANETNEKRKRYDISVNLNDPGYVVVGISQLVYKYIFIYVGSIVLNIGSRGRRGHDRILVRFTTTYAISVYHQQR